jgi:hypothetical protein
MQLLCNYFTKILRIQLVSTSNLIKHYNNYYKDILTSAIKERQMKKPDWLKRLDFFKKYSFKTKDYI